MSLYRFFKPTTSLSSAKDTGLPTHLVGEANKAVKEVLTVQNSASQSSKGKKRKYTGFTPEIRAKTGRFAAENGYEAAVKKFKAEHNIGESTVRLFKKKH